MPRYSPASCSSDIVQILSTCLGQANDIDVIIPAALAILRRYAPDVAGAMRVSAAWGHESLLRTAFVGFFGGFLYGAGSISAEHLVGLVDGDEVSSVCSAFGQSCDNFERGDPPSDDEFFNF